MSSVTAVPLLPIRKGSVMRLWLAIALVAVLAALLAWNGTRSFHSTKSGLVYQMIEEGEGASPARDDFAMVAYKGTLPDGKMFDENKQAPMDLTTLTPGFAEAVTLLKKGGRMRVKIPAELAYGATPPQGSNIPANSPLIFDISLIEFKSRAEVMEMQRQAQLQQMLQQQMQGGGAMPQPMPPQP